MGLEARSTAYKGKAKFEGKLYLDSEFLQFKSKELPWKLRLGKDVSAREFRGKLRVSAGDETLSFDVGEDTDRWIRKILNPPTLMTKLGIKENHRCWMSRGFSKEFRDELRAASAGITRSLLDSDLAFHFLPNRSELDQLANTLADLPEGINVWVVWPKSSPKVSQGEVMECASKFGYGPSKTAAFSNECSSMRFAKSNKK